MRRKWSKIKENTVRCKLRVVSYEKFTNLMREDGKGKTLVPFPLPNYPNPSLCSGKPTTCNPRGCERKKRMREAGKRLNQGPFPLASALFPGPALFRPIMQCRRIKICPIRPNKSVNFWVNAYLVK